MTALPLRALGVVAAACLATTALTAPSLASVPITSSEPSGDPGTVVATGLNSPRHLTAAPNGDLYVAESGVGGDDCVVLGADGPALGEDGMPVPCGSWDPGEHEDWTEASVGDTGSITKVSRKGGQERVVTGLPSAVTGAGGEAAGEATGPSGVSIRGNSLMITIGLGAPPAMRDAVVGFFGNDDYAAFATVQEAKFTGQDTVTVHQVADLAQYETDVNPHPAALDTNPNAIVRDAGTWLVTDAGGNSVLRMTSDGGLSTVAVPPDGTAVAPPFPGIPPGTMLPFEPVPTASAVGPDGATYVSLLTGFPFPVGGSSIWRVAPDGSMSQWATGLTNVTDLTWDNGSLYAVQLANNGLLSGDLTGSLLKINEGQSTHEVIADGLFAPYGVAVSKGTAYVTTGTVVPGGGQVVAFDLN